jgi:hypothetical protein
MIPGIMEISSKESFGGQALYYRVGVSASPDRVMHGAMEVSQNLQ